ncbi:MAG TPA: YoaK family protein [Hanamia sp.]|nr:YoaK family protein [Hanamia sp.]
MKSQLHKSTIWFEIMLVLLACVAGSVDVMSYYRLGHVFTANMTGNTILLGLAIGQGKMASSLHSLAALAGFFTGTLIGASIIENTKKAWSHYVTLCMTIETIIIAILVLIWFEESVITNNYVLYISIILSAIAMGIQSATIWHLKIPGVVTTFLTGTITTIGMSTVNGIKKSFGKKLKENEFPGLPIPKTLERRIELQVIIFISYGCTAVLTGWLEYHGSHLLPLLPLTLIIIVLLIVINRPEHPHILRNLRHSNAEE